MRRERVKRERERGEASPSEGAGGDLGDKAAVENVILVKLIATL